MFFSLRHSKYGVLYYKAMYNNTFNDDTQTTSPISEIFRQAARSWDIVTHYVITFVIFFLALNGNASDLLILCSL